MNLPSSHSAGPRFRPGRIFITPSALAVLQKSDLSILDLLLRHLRGDWGDISDEDRKQNDLSVIAGLRLLSSYPLPGGGKVWLITERDRSGTTILLPGDY